MALEEDFASFHLVCPRFHPMHTPFLSVDFAFAFCLEYNCTLSPLRPLMNHPNYVCSWGPETHSQCESWCCVCIGLPHAWDRGQGCSWIQKSQKRWGEVKNGKVPSKTTAPDTKDYRMCVKHVSERMRVGVSVWRCVWICTSVSMCLQVVRLCVYVGVLMWVSLKV